MKEEINSKRKFKKSIGEPKGKSQIISGFLYFNDEWNTESPTDDDEGLTISDEDGYEDGIDSFPTKNNKTIVDDSYPY